MQTFIEKDVKNRLENLSEAAKIIFAASCCERALPSYKKFVEIEHWGDYEFFRDTLNEIWMHAYNKKIPEDRLQQLIKQASCLMPDEEDFESIFTSYALEASIAICNALKYCLTKEIKKLISIPKLLIATVDLFVQEQHDMNPSDLMLEEKIIKDPLMKNELKNQLDDIHLLESQKINGEFVNAFRLRIEGKSNIVL